MLSIVSVILVLAIIPTGIYSISLPVAVFGQSDDDDNSSQDNEDNNTPDSSISNSGNSKYVILTLTINIKANLYCQTNFDNTGLRAPFMWLSACLPSKP